MTNTANPNNQDDQFEKMIVARSSELAHSIEMLQRQVSTMERAEDHLRKLWNVFEQAPISIVITDLNGVIEYVNPWFTEVTGYTSQDVLGKTPRILKSGFTSPATYETLWATIKSGQKWRGEFYNRKKDGTLYWESVLISPILNKEGEIVNFVAIREDITERKQAEDALRENARRMEQIEHIAQLGHWELNLKTQELTWSDEIYRIFGLKPEKAVATYDGFLQAIHPDDRKMVNHAYTQSVETKTPYEIMHRIVTPDGSVKFVIERCETSYDESGTALRSVGTIQDVSQHEHFDREMQTLIKRESRRREELETLSKISISLREATQSAHFLEMLTSEMQELSSAFVVCGVLFKGDQTVHTPIGSAPLTAEQTAQIATALQDVRAGQVSTMITGLSSALVLPLKSSSALHGAVLLASPEPNFFTDDEQNMLRTVADMAGTALQRIEMLETLETRVEGRTHELVVLYNLMTIISESWHLQDILELSLVLTLETVKLQKGIIYLVDANNPRKLSPVMQRGFSPESLHSPDFPGLACAYSVLERAEPQVSYDVGGKVKSPDFADVDAHAGIPIRAHGKLLGVFSLYARDTRAFSADVMALLSSIADHVGIGIQSATLFEQGQKTAVFEERNRLARDLHDSVSQLLYSLTLMAGSTQRLLDKGDDQEAVKAMVKRVGETAHQALKEMRLLLYELRPAVLDSDGLASALRHRVETVEVRSGLVADVQTGELPPLSAHVEDGLYHIALEALNNIIKHSNSPTVRVHLFAAEGRVTLEIGDTGKGFDVSATYPGMGLKDMHERSLKLGGELSIQSKPGEGTTVRVSAPVA